jgi:two-component system NarL family response regulator
MRVLLADDHPLFVAGLKSLLSGRGVQVVATARDGLEALEKARRERPDVILMDIHMPRCDGLAATQLIKAELPEIKIVMLTMSGESDVLFEAIRSGASGYLLKTLDTEEFFNHLMELSRGEAPLSPGLAARVLDLLSEQAGAAKQRKDAPETSALTSREREVLALVARGFTYKEVAQQLCLSERTIKYHMSEIIARLQLKNKAQAVQHAKRSGWV